MTRCSSARYLSVVLVGLTSGVASAGSSTPSAIFSSSGPLSAVPGEPGIQFVSFDRPIRSPGGTRWALLARTNAPSVSDALYLTGQGTTGVVRIREGVTEIEPGRTSENVADRRIGVNDLGDYAVSVNLTGNTADDAVIVKGLAAGGFIITAREGSLVPPAAGLPVGTTYGLISSTINSVQLTTNGNPSFTAPVIGSGITSANDLCFFLPNGSLALREGISPYGEGTASSFYVDSTAGNWLAVAKVAGAPAATDDALWVNGAIVLREGFEVAPSMPSGTYGTIGSFFLPTMESNADWLARGRTSNGTGFAVRNGLVLAKTGDLVPGGEPGEAWSSDPWTFATDPTFFHLSANNLGDFMIGGFTNNPDGSRNAAWVLNNSEVVLRAGDQVDLDGDSVLDDAYIWFSNLSGASPTSIGGFLTDDLWFYFTADIRNQAGASLGQAYMRLLVPEPTMLGLLAAAVVAARRRRC